LAGRKSLIVGGTGFLGKRIAEALQRAGDQVTLLTRGQALGFRPHFQVASTLDVPRAIACVAHNSAAYGCAYDVAQAELYTAESWIEACAGVLGLTPRYAHVAENDPAGYLLPVAGRPFGHALFDCSALRCELGFEPSPESVWLADTLRGCLANPPAGPSAGYDRRSEELSSARTSQQEVHARA
jgi:nucleoside-diphosphate-sugar epimerase